MANHVSSLKRVRITKRRTAINKIRKSRMRHAIRALRRALEQKDAAAAAKLLPKTFSLIDRAAKWGVIKDNTASRYKSRLHKRLKALEGMAPQA
ncbi:MAG: 30S ribosomal protein S20 [Bryobacteraceae bacterium]|jgi:small subunit ribosomal protein S20